MLVIIALQACSSSSNSRYSIKQDTAPTFDYGELTYTEPVPQYEPYNVWTSKPYQVLGRSYVPLLDGLGFEDTGYASWYGQKFHGHTTANGEVFDMFALTAAHTTLPLPSFVKVTNLENGKSTTVRVNDRGPFHDNRILDLSYGAAKKLGFHQQGTAKVKIEVIHVSKNGIVNIGKNKQSTQELANIPNSVERNTNNEDQVSTSIAPSTVSDGLNTTEIRQQSVSIPLLAGDDVSAPLLFVQVTASSDHNKVKELATGLSNLLQVPNSIPFFNNVYRLHLGPLENEQKAQKLIQDLDNLGFDKTFTLEFRP